LANLKSSGVGARECRQTNHIRAEDDVLKLEPQNGSKLGSRSMPATLEVSPRGAFQHEIVTRGGNQRSFQMALSDVSAGFAVWRLWGRMGWNDILQRYRRSLLGPFWLTASMAIMVVSLGVLYAELFKTPIHDFLPFLCVGLLIWNLLASFLTEGGAIFTTSESYIKQIRLPYSVYVYRSMWSKLIIFAHNFVIYFGVLIYFQIWPGAAALLAIPGLILIVVNGALATVYIGILSARFRDIPQLINSVVQIIFFVTPIMWKPELLSGRTYIADVNPFYHLVEVVRAPLLGHVPEWKNYLAVLLITAINLGLAGYVFTRFRSRISYWI
jgi:lipopolysaccharide transport system permease protein